MIDGLKPYPEYKESGLPWVGKIPAHWSASRLRHACEMLVSNVDKHSKSGELPVRLCNYVDVYKNERIHRRLRFMRATASNDEVERFRVRSGDVLITKDSEEWNDIGVPSLVEYEAPDFVCGYHLAILRPRSKFSVGGYLLRALQCHQIAAQFHVEAHGVTRYGLSHGAIRSVSIPVPPPDEQAAIVRFLDHANGRIEWAIRAKRKLMALLNEQKQAIIHRAVTRGLEPNVPLKPSGIPWLGDIPEHWQAMPAKRACSLIRDGTHLPPPRTPTGFPLLSVRNIINGRLVRRSDDSFVSREHFDQLNASFVVQPNDVLMAIVGATLGKVAVVEDIGPFQIQRSVAIFRPRPAILFHEFFATVVRSPRLQQHLWQSVAFSAQPGIYLGFVANMAIPVPPTIVEQTLICEWLKDEIGPLNAALARTEREIGLLREYRTRLIADVVTGKLDVRDAVRQLPEAPAEPEITPDAEDLLESETMEADV
jgi:type I restriction enzyme, S subunit